MKHWCLLAVCSMVLVGCDLGTPEPSPTPSPVSSSSAVASPTPSDAALYAEAERVYLAFQSVRQEYSATGDYGEFPVELAQYLTPHYLESFKVGFEMDRARGARLVGGARQQTTEPAPGVSKGESEVALLTCSDARGLTIVSNDGEVVPGTLVVGNYFFEHHEGELKISGSDLWEAEECPVG